MTVTRMRVEGLRELDRNLGRLGKATGKAVLRRVGKNVLKPMAAIAKSAAPRDQGNLAESIIVGTKIAGGDVGKQAFAKVLQGGGSRGDAVSALRAARRGASTVSVYMGPGRHPQAIFQEFGTVTNAPQPFMRPAWDQDKMAMLERIKDDLWNEITRAIQRAQRRAARS